MRKLSKIVTMQNRIRIWKLPVPSLSPSLEAKYLDLFIAIRGVFLFLITWNAADKFSWLNLEGANPTTTESTYLSSFMISQNS